MAVTNVTELNELVARVKKAQREFAGFSVNRWMLSSGGGTRCSRCPYPAGKTGG